MINETVHLIFLIMTLVNCSCTAVFNVCNMNYCKCHDIAEELGLNTGRQPHAKPLTIKVQAVCHELS